MSQELDFDDTSDPVAPLTDPPIDQPFNDLPRLPPAAELESKTVLRQCIRSRAALAELKQATELIPNPEVLIEHLPVLEARASSEIENVFTTAERMFRQLGQADRGSQSQGADPATREALRYREALIGGFESLSERPLSTRTAEIVCSRIKGQEMTVRRVPGTQLADGGSGEVIYTPPEGEPLLRDLLANWERFVHGDDDLDPLVRMAVAHYQFEAIHPFTDGNGRTGRILNILLLVERGLLPQPILYLSRYVVAHKPDYYERLQAVTREKDWQSWILYMLRGVEETARWTTEKIAAIRRLEEVTIDHLRQALPKIYSRELVDVIFERPYCRIGDLVDAGIVERQAASRYLKQLVEVGVLEEEVEGREKLFPHPKLLRLLTEETNEVAPYPRTD